jgi:predicted AlkP superfamily phosphohydrolase/phosphomutase
VARRLVRNKPWDFFMLVEMGPDRLHHVFWQHFDPKHPKYEPGNQFETAFQDYYRFLDAEVGKLLEALPDDAIVILMSDHGARPMVGGVCFNDWLAQQGYLAFTEALSGPTPIAQAPIDWTRTIAWGDGGYYGRLFLNVKGREPPG